MMKKLSVAVVSSFVFGALTVRAADTWYLKQTMGAKEYAAMSDPSYWVDASGSTVCPAMNTTDTYVVGDGYRLSCNSDNPFAGGPLVIGKDGQHALNILYCNGHCNPGTVPMTWYAGYATHGTASGSSYTISMPVTVTAPAATPFGLSISGSNTKGFVVSTISGERGTGLVVGGYFNYSTDKIVTHSATNVSYTVGSTANGYRGDLTVVSGKNTLEPSGYGNVMLFLSNYPDEVCGAYEVKAGAGLSLQTQKELKLSSFTLHADSAVRFAVDGKNVPSVRVSETFAVPPEEDGKVLLFFSKTPVRAAGDDAAKSLILSLLTVPDTQTLDPSRFCTNLDGDFYLNVSTNDVAHTRTLELVLPGQVKLETGDSTDYATDQTTLATYGSALTNAAQWSDKALPHADANGRKIIYSFGQKTGYGNTIRTPFGTDAYDPTQDYVFPGTVLRAIGKAQAILVFANNQAFEANIESDATAFRMRVANGKAPILRGTIHSDVEISSYAYAGSVLMIESEISGAASYTVKSYTSTGSPSATTVFAGDNSRWTGSITVTQGANPSNGFPTFNKTQTVRFSEEKNLGGPLESFNYKAVQLQDYCILTTTNDVTLSKSTNRGLFVSGIGSISVPKGVTMNLCWPVTFDGALYKWDVGTLGLGGSAKFLDSDGELADVPPAEAEKRTFVVTNGCVKALSHDCLNGVTISLSPVIVKNKVVTNSSLMALPFNPADADLKRYGFYNVKTETPFIPGQTISFKLADVDADALEVARATDAGYKQGLITVKTTAAKNVEDNLVIEKVKGLRLIREDDAETETTTFSLYGKKEGVLLIVR